MSVDAYKEFSKSFDEYFSSVKKDFPSSPENLYDPVQYFLSLDGKRIRPLLVLIAADCFNEKISEGLPAAAAVELFHNFSLIHDDIMDKAPLRRGKATVHEKWNSNIAILSGDVLLVKAYQELSKCKNALRLQEIFSQTAIGVCEGQQLDMDFEKRSDVTIADYKNMIRLKTAVLLAASLQMGALCAGADEKSASTFYEAGEKLGLAFQLTDDYLDVFGKAEKTGKQSGGDIIANKKTWLLIKAFELSNEIQQQELSQWMSNTNSDPKQKVAAIRKTYTDLGLPSLLEKEIEGYYQDAFNDLNNACHDKQKIDAFVSFIKTLMKREK